MPPKPVYLWTLPMFHCNGWCFPWSVTAMGGTHVCLRKVDPAMIFPMIVEHGVTHMCGAPTVLEHADQAPAEQRRSFDHVVDIQTGGSPPPAKVIKAMEELGFRVTHIYGMTEIAGPVDALRAAGRLGRSCRSRSAPRSPRARACATRWSRARWSPIPKT